jgi:carbon-monoxide dehydrogenase medium subunit
MAHLNSIKEYHGPGCLEDASSILASHPESAKILAGGTDLLIQLSTNNGEGIHVVSLKNIDELKGIRKAQDGSVFIGAMATHAEVARSPLVIELFPALAQASAVVGSPSIRNMATIGGNICNSSPSAETAPPLLIYEAKVVVWSPTGERILAVGEFFTGPSKNILKTGELLKGIILKPEKGLRSAYEKLGIRKAMEIAIVNVGVSMVLKKDKSCSEPRIALGAVAPTPIRAKKAEKILRNQKLTPELVKKAALSAAGESRPISDIRASAEYRKKMVAFLVEKLLLELSGLNRA